MTINPRHLEPGVMAYTCNLATSKAFQDGVDFILVLQKVGQNLTKYCLVPNNESRISFRLNLLPLGELPVKCKYKCKFMHSFQDTLNLFSKEVSSCSPNLSTERNFFFSKTVNT